MKPGALIASLVLGWILVGLIVIELIMFLIALASMSYARAPDYLLLVGVPLLLASLLGGCLIGLAKGSPVARILYAVLGGILALLAIVGLVTLRIHVAMVIVTLLQLLLVIGSIVCAFLPAVSGWMAYGRGSGNAAYGGGYPQQGDYGQGPAGAWNQPPQQQGWPAPPAPQFAASAGQAAEPNLRPCPHCAEPIRVEASKCRFCGSAVQPLA